MMAIYVLTPAEGIDFGYDNYDGFVIRAQNETEARRLACYLAVKDNLYRDKANWWLDADKATCKEVPPEGGSECILASFHYG